MKSKEEIIQSVEYIFENTKRIHGKSEAIDWQKVAIHKSVSYILSELADLKAQLKQAEAEPIEKHDTCDGCQMFSECGCMLDDSCPDCDEHYFWTPKDKIVEIKATPMPSGWICPRCQKVHSWLSMTCDCEPKTITRTTYDPSDFPCIH